MPRTAVRVSTYQTPQKIWVKQTWIQILEASSLVDLTYLLLLSSSSTASHSPLYLSPPPYFLLDGGFSPTVVYLECYLTHTQYITIWIFHHCLYLAVLLLVSPSVTYLNSLALYKSHVPLFLCFLSPFVFVKLMVDGLLTCKCQEPGELWKCGLEAQDPHSTDWSASGARIWLQKFGLESWVLVPLIYGHWEMTGRQKFGLCSQCPDIFTHECGELSSEQKIELNKIKVFWLQS